MLDCRTRGASSSSIAGWPMSKPPGVQMIRQRLFAVEVCWSPSRCVGDLRRTGLSHDGLSRRGLPMHLVA
jgi:hypothetical protein